MNKDAQLIYEAYRSTELTPPPVRLVNEGIGEWAVRVHAWWNTDAKAWLKENGHHIAGLSLAAIIALIIKMGIDPPEAGKIGVEVTGQEMDTALEDKLAEWERGIEAKLVKELQELDKLAQYQGSLESPPQEWYKSMIDEIGFEPMIDNFWLDQHETEGLAPELQSIPQGPQQYSSEQEAKQAHEAAWYAWDELRQAYIKLTA